MDAVEEIKSRLSIEDVVSQYLELKRSGRNFKGLSPFSNEKTPSLMVSPEKQIWHDFSSSKGGDMFSFVMEVEGIDFKAALDILARQAGVELQQFHGRSSSDGAQKERLYQALELAAKFYQVHLSKHSATLDYVRTARGYNKETILSFRLGYAPDESAALTSFLAKKGFTVQELKKAGLSTQRRSGIGDMFRNRLMIPLMDQQGRVIGFTARILKDDKNAPKYINTPASPVYDKSRHVFGLHLAKESIRKQNYAVVVEGNLDVIASHQSGVLNVVATAGTALTEAHLKTISRFTDDIRLAFDQDAAGLAATERSLPIASKVGVSLSIITVPEGKDPDELVRINPEAWHQATESQLYAIDWVIERHKSLNDITSAKGKRQFTDSVLPIIRQLTDSVERDHYVRVVAELIGISVDAVSMKLEEKKPKNAKPTIKRPMAIDQQAVSVGATEYIRTQDRLLSLAWVLPSLRGYLSPITTEMMTSSAARAYLIFLRQEPEYNQVSPPESLRQYSDYGKILQLLYEELYRDLEVLELRYEAARLQVHLIETYVKITKNKLSQAMQGASDADVQTLLEKAKKLDILLKSIKEQRRGR